MADAPETPGQRTHVPEWAPSELTRESPSTARTVGMVGWALICVGTLAVILNTRTSTPRLIGTELGSAFVLLGMATTLYHAGRDADSLVRHLYLGLGIALIGVGAVVSLAKKPEMGGLFLPWGAAGLSLGLFYLITAGRHEREHPWTTITDTLLALGGIGLLIVGFLGMAVTGTPLLSISVVVTLGVIYAWSSSVRSDTSTPWGLWQGRLIGVIGLAAILYGTLRSALPGVAYSAGWITEQPSGYFVPNGLLLVSFGVVTVLLSVGLVSDWPVVAMTRRELGAFFYSPIAYLVILGMAFVGWLQYRDFLVRLMRAALRGQSVPEPVVASYIFTIIPVFAVMFAVPVITMRLLAEEKRSGTIEVLLTGPVNEFAVVFSKFLAALICFFVLVLPWGLYLIPVYFESRGGFDYLPLFGFYLALLATGSAFVSMGLFMSSLTRNQIIAAALTFAGMVFYLAVYFIADQATGPLKTILDQVSFVDLWFNALQGKVYVHRLLTYFSITAFWLFLTTKVLEARKWS